MTLTKDELDELDIKSWQDYASIFTGSPLFLGNGFSIKQHAAFSYSSLYTAFLHQCVPSEVSFFNSFSTTNFEAIQHQLAITAKVNGLLSLPTLPLDPYVSKLRNGFITVIQSVHPTFANIPPSAITNLSQQLDAFGDIFTTNYDLYLYHVIMKSKDRHNANNSVRPYNDYFWGQWNYPFLEFRDYQNYTHYKHIYFLHGALFLFPGWTQGHYNTLKIRRAGSRELLDIVGDQIHHGAFPLFVSEGTSPQKQAVIAGDSYLSFSLRQFRNTESSLVIYGSALDPQYDKHILDAINFCKRSLAVSIYVGNRSFADVKAEQHLIASRLALHDVLFFDASTLF